MMQSFLMRSSNKRLFIWELADINQLLQRKESWNKESYRPVSILSSILNILDNLFKIRHMVIQTVFYFLPYATLGKILVHT